MAKSEKQKLKTLYVAKYFMEYTDERHYASTSDIIDYLQDECGIEAERRSIYRDIEALRNEFGMDISGEQGGRYRLKSRQFEYDDLILLAECVYAAKFISEAKAKELVSSISELCSIYQAEKLQQEVYLCDRVKTSQKGTLNIISTIRAAMAAKRATGYVRGNKIRFKYLMHTIDDINTMVERRGGEDYIVSPFKLLINDGNYYLIGFDDKYKEIRTYRIDRMKNVELIDEFREGRSEMLKIDIENYIVSVFSMFNGEKSHVSIRFANHLLDSVIDRFGTGSKVFYRPDGEEHFVVTTDVAISGQFFGWLVGFGTDAKLLSPEGMVEDFREYLREVNSLY